MAKRKIPNIVGEALRESELPPISLRTNRKRLVCGLYPKTRVSIEVYSAPKPNVLLNIDSSDNWFAFGSLDELFRFLSNNYTLDK